VFENSEVMNAVLGMMHRKKDGDGSSDATTSPPDAMHELHIFV